jgi:Zn finger protein HypA/HybF involved in hydrogenase expression
MKMTKSEAGKLGAEKTILKFKIISEEKKVSYLNNPNLCTCCNSPIAYEKRNNKFCSQSCSASFNNSARGRKTSSCLNCGKEIGEGGKYCSRICQNEFETKEKLEVWNTTGKLSQAAIRFIREKFENKCSCCGISEWNKKPITLELEHIDGNSDNNQEINLTILCPNCHSQTPTYKAKNKGNGRHSRKLRYRAGKSF